MYRLGNELLLIPHWRHNPVFGLNACTLQGLESFHPVHCVRSLRYSASPLCQSLNSFSPALFSPRFSRTEYFGRGTFDGNSYGSAASKTTSVLVNAKISRAKSYQEQAPSAVA